MLHVRLESLLRCQRETSLTDLDLCTDNLSLMFLVYNLLLPMADIILRKLDDAQQTNTSQMRGVKTKDKRQTETWKTD